MRSIFSSAKALGDGTVVATMESLPFNIDRHSVEHCECSFCRPYAADYTKLPRPGRFGAEVPPRGNRWKWTQFTWRWGKWQYYWTLRAQIFPSVRPFFRKERWQ